ncbi:hypothetical protein WJX74_010382 [Apatococcus lobatus]|uniref:VPS10 domain-containing protein n=1 Tax=Apatococcus lobatus TaxID=904363 RepID=A0AAW1RDH7_9CHLO
MTRRLYFEAVHLWLAVSALCCCQVRGTCLGDGCDVEHAQAKSSGLLGSSNNVCPDKSYPAKDPLQPLKVSSPLVDFRWFGPEHEGDKYVFGLTQGEYGAPGGHLWRSDDYGRDGTWSDVSDKMEGAWGGDRTDEQGVLEIIHHWGKPQQLLFLGPGFHHWISGDYGSTFETAPTPGNTLGFWNQIKTHPRQPDWLAAQVRRRDCLEAGARTNPWCAWDVFVSKDFGRNWQNLTENSKGKIAAFWDFDWGAKVHWGDKELSMSDETILATVYDKPEAMKGPYPAWDKDIHFVRSDDLFVKHDKLVACGNQIEVLAGKVFLAMPSDCPVEPSGSKRNVPASATGRNSVSMYISDDEALSFSQACLPVKWLDRGYNLKPTHDFKSAFMIVDHDETDEALARLPIGNIFAPGANSSMYTMSLPRVYEDRYVADFVRVDGLPGYLLANQFNGDQFNDPSWQPIGRQTDEDTYVQSKVSFNGGAHWQDLARPDRYRHAGCDRCGNVDPEACRLHLHGPAGIVAAQEAMPVYYSHWNAPGVVMAVGNSGEHLDEARDAQCTWLSRNGGETWEDVAQGAFIYEFGDHGGIIVMAAHGTERPASNISFSLDEGRCWQTIHLAEAIDVSNIRAEPEGTSHIFIVHGEACTKSDRHPTCTHEGWGEAPAGRAYILNFQELLGSDWPGCSPSDYEDWKPGRCMLGQNYTIERRKPDTRCFNGRDYHRPNSTGACECQAADLECEFGYEYSDGECKPIVGVDTTRCGPLTSGEYAPSETHKRLIHGDTCSNLEALITDTDGMGHRTGDSPSGHRSVHWGVAIASFLVVILVGAGAFAWWVFYAPEGVRSTIEEMAAPITGFCGSAFGWIRDKISGLTTRRDAQHAYFEPLSGGEGLDLSIDEARSPNLFPTR